eukprot:gene22185-26750_t
MKAEKAAEIAANAAQIAESASAEAKKCLSQEEAAVKIQARQRGIQSRKRVHQIKSKKFKELEEVADGAAHVAMQASEQVASAAQDAQNAFDELEKELGLDTIVIFVVGAAGSGKATMCPKIAEEFGYVHLIPNELLKHEVDNATETGLSVLRQVKEGKLIPSNITTGLLKSAMLKSSTQKFLVEGFPRALDQCLEFEKDVKKCDLVLFFDCPEDIAEKRMIEKGAAIGRIESVPTIKKRYGTFCTQTMPAIEYYKTKGLLRMIDSSADIDAVFEKTQAVILKAVDTLLDKKYMFRPSETYYTSDSLKKLDSFGINDEQTKAVIKIQAVQRGRVARKRVQNIKEKATEANESAAIACEQAVKISEDIQAEKQAVEKAQEEEAAVLQASGSLNALDTPPLTGLEVYFVLGGPGSGKGTQCEKIVAEYGFTHLS